MAKFFITFFLFCSLGFFGQTEVSTVLNHMIEQEKAWNNGNVNEFMKYYWKHDSLMFIGSKGITYGWQKTLDNYLKSYPNRQSMGTLHFTIDYAKMLSPVNIYIIGKWELSKEKPAGGHFTLLWQKIDGRWVIVADHTS